MLTAKINHIFISFSAVQIYDLSSFHLFNYFDNMIFSGVFIKLIRRVCVAPDLAQVIVSESCSTLDIFNPDEIIASPCFLFLCPSCHRQLD